MTSRSMYRVPTKLPQQGMNPPTKVGPYPRPGTWRAPTWSWASTKAAVEYCWNTDDGGDFLARHISVIDFQIGQVSQNPLGQLRAAKLIVSGQLATAKIQHYHGEDMTHGTMSSPIAIEVSGELKETTTCFVDYDLWTKSDQHVVDGESVHCLKVGTWNLDGTSSRDVNYLILRRCQRSAGEDSERIGLLWRWKYRPDYFTEFATREIVLI
jgi:hypothetical protein